MKKRGSIISLVKKRQTIYLKKTHKFGVEMPKTVKEAAKLDANNGDTKCMDAIPKEITNVRVAFDIPKDGDRAHIGHKQINCPLIYDVKMEDFRRKA